jgi:hypothetical protein
LDLQINGRVIEVLDEQSGEGRNGPWRKREFILETEGSYPKKICIVQWGDEIDQTNVVEGEQITAHIDIQSREYNGRWYTDVKAWRIQREAAAASGAAGPGGPGMPAGGEAEGPGMPGGSSPSDYDPDEDDDLPF